jgi:hypothetical protein
MDDETLAADMLRGVREIARFIGMPEKRVYYMIESGFLPVGKLGGRVWFASKRGLRAHFEKITGSLAPATERQAARQENGSGSLARPRRGRPRIKNPR